MFKCLAIRIIPAVALILVAAGCEPAGPAPQGATNASPASSPSPGDTVRSECQNNLKQLGLGCKTYAREHDGRFPDTILALLPEYNPDNNCYRCPGAGQAPARATGAPTTSDYEVVPGLTEKSPGKTILIREKNTGNHTPPGRNVLYVDGHVEFLTGSE